MQESPKTDATSPAESPDWLSHLQKYSWEPEVIISGLSLAFIFAFPAQIYSFSVYLIQDLGIPFVGSWLVLLYLSLIINVLKIFFSVHLVMRFTWAGLLGVSYAFPDGIIREKLFKSNAGLSYSQPAELVIRLERWCSIAFAVPLLIGFPMLFVAGYLMLLLSAYVFFDWSFTTIYVFFMISMLVLGLVGTQIRRFPRIANRYARSLFPSLAAAYQSNLGKWSVLGYMLFIVVVAVPFIARDTSGFFSFFHEISLSDTEIRWPDAGIYYADEAASSDRFSRLQLESATVSRNFLVVKLAHYEGLNKEIEGINRVFGDSLKAWNWKKPEVPTDLFRFFLGETELFPSSWQTRKMPGTGQKVYTTVLNLQEIPEGAHTLRVERISYFESFLFAAEIVKRRKTWAVVPFYKVPAS